MELHRLYAGGLIPMDVLTHVHVCITDYNFFKFVFLSDFSVREMKLKKN